MSCGHFDRTHLAIKLTRRSLNPGVTGVFGGCWSRCSASWLPFPSREPLSCLWTPKPNLDQVIGHHILGMSSTIERKTLETNEEPVDEVLQMPPSLLTCGGCQQSIGDRFFLKAIEQYWHEDCLSCDLCGCRLGEVGRRLYYKLGRKLCRRDYLRLFGQDGLCASCEKRIRAFEMTMRVRDKVYHLECFKCAACQKHFCVGDRYLLINSDIVCEQDIYEWTKLNNNNMV